MNDSQENEDFDVIVVGGRLAGAGLANHLGKAGLNVLKSKLSASQEELKVVKEEVHRLQKDLDKSLSEKEELRGQHSVVLEKFAKLKEAVYAERSKAEKAEARASEVLFLLLIVR